MGRVRFKKFKIFNSIVRSVTVPMMNDFFRFEIAPNVFFHHQAVLAHVNLFTEKFSARFRRSFPILFNTTWVLREIHLYIAILRLPSAPAPIWMTDPGTGSGPLTLDSIPFTNLVNQLGSYSRIKNLCQSFSNFSLSMSLFNPLANLLYGVVNAVVSCHPKLLPPK